jgi:hypothetical protein
MRRPPNRTVEPTERRPRSRGPAAAGRAYQVLCLAALVVILVVQIEQQAGVSAWLFLLVGLLGVAACLRSAPILVLLVLAGQQFLTELAHAGYGRRWSAASSLRVADVVLCGAVLAYVVAHYRLQGLVHNVVPLDPRRRAGPPRWHFWRLGWLPRVVQERRSPRLVSPVEVGLLVMTLPAAPLLAQALWAGLAPPWTLWSLRPPLWRLLLITWILAMGLFVAAAVLRHWARRRMSVDEATLLLQDVVWHETRREQRRINRWLAWARLRARP